MRSSLQLVLGLAAIPTVLCSACAPVPPPVAPPAPVAQPAPAPAQVATTSYELTPVREPAGLIGIARWKSPASTLAAMATCAGMPQAVVDKTVPVVLEKALGEALRGSVDAKALAAVIAMDVPVDAALALDEGAKKPFVGAFSIGLTSLERAREAAESTSGHPLTELSPGEWKLAPVKGLSCVIAASAGPTPARLVCGGREKDLTALAPFLTRTAATRTITGGDLHGELHFAPVETRYGSMMRQTLAAMPLMAQSELSLGEPRFDKAVLDAATGLEEEVLALTGDLDKLVLDFATGSTTCLKTSTAIVLKGKKSWIASGIADRLDRAGSPPAIFWRLPKDAETATYTSGADPARYDGILRTGRSLLEGALAKKNFGSAADRKALVDLLSFPLKKDTVTVHANGHPLDVDAPAAKSGKPNPQAEIDALLGGSIGWTLYGFDESSANIAKAIKDVVAVYNRNGFQTPLKKELKGDAKKFVPSIKVVAAPAKLGRDALDVEIKISNIPAPDVKVDRGNVAITAGKGKGGSATAPKKTVTITAHLLLMADGGATWVAVGLDRNELVNRLLATKTGSAPTTLASRTGLDELKNGRTLSGGFLTVGYFTRAAASGVSKYLSVARAGSSDAPEVLGLLTGLPHKGETPIVLTTTAVAAGAGTRGEVTLAIPRDAVEDVSALVMNATKLAAKARKP